MLHVVLVLAVIIFQQMRGRDWRKKEEGEELEREGVPG
jgi:hypothetical protein